MKRADPLLWWLWSPEIPDTQKNSADLSFPKYKMEAFFVELLKQKQTKLWKQQPRALLLFNRTIKKEGQTLLGRQGRVPLYWGEILSEGAFLGTLEITCTPIPWFLRISVVQFTLVPHFQKIAKIFSLCDFHYMHFWLLMTSVLRIRLLRIFARLKKRTSQGLGVHGPVKKAIMKLIFHQINV